MYVCIYSYVCIYVYMYTYIHTYMFFYVRIYALANVRGVIEYKQNTTNIVPNNTDSTHGGMKCRSRRLTQRAPCLVKEKSQVDRVSLQKTLSEVVVGV